ncbi:polysaccharide deacetylase family protein [Geobacter sp. DSM 9736]|uniref:polysaccharide deacetylase family protein n=1 Tax=Geobacter sp. DSM 9736 TaxID=1277350 RepID=UPI000B5015C5|nr:polysaccharide deacetylase family protein [Geobacter sp. DSM 9736]SNB47955.1 Peptidoglycan/xylan/chitin deacetylase, PgdA/CDA1 family [Geobacter sp. DSM 9736]
MYRKYLGVLTLAAITAVAPPISAALSNTDISVSTDPFQPAKKMLTERYGNISPKLWGEVVPGVKTRISGTDKLIALTLDACGSARGIGIDQRLVEFLEQEQVPATLFINARWVGPNRSTLQRLAANPLFEIANHGLHHRPASVNGRQAYGIAGTRNISELVDEIELNNRKLSEVTGHGPRYFRSGTAYYDEVAVKIAADLGMEVVGFSLLGDAGATFSREQVRRALLAAKPGDIVILHMNHPGSGTADGVMDAVPELKRRGFRFVRLSDVALQ